MMEPSRALGFLEIYFGSITTIANKQKVSALPKSLP